MTAFGVLEGAGHRTPCASATVSRVTPRVAWLVASVLFSGACGKSDRTDGRVRASASSQQAPRPQVAQIAGRITAHDGNPLHRGLVLVAGSFDRLPVAKVRIGGDSQFSLALPETGFYWLTVLAPDHAYFRRGLFVDDDDRITVTGRLGTKPRDAVGDRLELRLRWLINGEIVPGGVVAATREATFHKVTLAAPTGAMSVQIQFNDLFTGQRGNVPGGRGYGFEEPYFWTDFDLPADGRLKIDTSLLPPAGLEPSIELVGASVVETDEVAAALELVRLEAQAVLAEPLVSSAFTSPPADSGADSALGVSTLESIATREHERIVAIADKDRRHAEAIAFALLFSNLVHEGRAAPSTIAWVLDVVPPTDRQWATQAPEIHRLFLEGFRTIPTATQYLANMSAGHADRGVLAASLWLSLTQAMDRGDLAVARQIQDKLRARFPSTYPAFLKPVPEDSGPRP